MWLTHDERERKGAWRLGSLILESTAVREEPKRPKAEEKPPSIFQSIYKVLDKPLTPADASNPF